MFAACFFACFRVKCNVKYFVSYEENIMAGFKSGLKLSGSLIVAAIISVFLCVSMNVICSAIFTVETGYKAYVYENEESTETIAEYEYTYTDNNGDGKDDGTDMKLKEYEYKGYIVNTVKQRSALTGVGKTVFLVVTQAFCIVMIIAFAATLPYKQGFKDANLIKTGHIKNDILKGFKIGLIGNLPFLVIAILMIVCSTQVPNFRTVWYAFLSGHMYSFIMWITSGAQTLKELTLTQHILLVLLQLMVPVISGIAYILGKKEINIAEKLVYKKEEK